MCVVTDLVHSSTLPYSFLLYPFPSLDNQQYPREKKKSAEWNI